MHQKFPILFVIIFFWYGLVSQCFGQMHLSGIIDAGHTTSLGAYGSCSLMADYRYDRIGVRFGISALPSSKRETFLNGIYIQGEYVFRVIDRPLTLKAKYLWKPISDEIREMNLAMAVDYALEHWYFLLGNNYRRYGLRSSYRKSHGYDRSESTITEPWNLMYAVSYQVFASGHKWNLSGTVTNIDYFHMAQETNPMFKLKGTYKPKSRLDLFVESWYKNAGLFNIQVNYYGFFFRFGVEWNIPF